MGKTKIEWTDETDNVIVVRGEDGKPHGWYCQKVSPGCANCYAESVNGSAFFKGNGLKYRVPVDGVLPPLMLREEILAGWARKTAPKRRFINSMTDTFGEFVPEEWIFRILDAMTVAPSQTFQMLTKRCARAKEVIDHWLMTRGLQALPSNIWMGTSVENQEQADKRILYLLNIPARIRFLSMEPLLGPVDLRLVADVDGFEQVSDVLRGVVSLDGQAHSPTPSIRWVIVGGESGPHARPMHPDWVRSLRNQCGSSDVPFFFKQWGGKHTAGRLLDGREWSEFPL